MPLLTPPAAVVLAAIAFSFSDQAPLPSSVILYLTASSLLLTIYLPCTNRFMVFFTGHVIWFSSLRISALPWSLVHPFSNNQQNIWFFTDQCGFLLLRRSLCSIHTVLLFCTAPEPLLESHSPFITYFRLFCITFVLLRGIRFITKLDRAVWPTPNKTLFQQSSKERRRSNAPLPLLLTPASRAHLHQLAPAPLFPSPDPTSQFSPPFWNN